MPTTSKHERMLEGLLEYHVRQKWVCTLHLVSELLDDLPDSDDESTGSSSSISSVSTPSSASVDVNSESSSSESSSRLDSSDSEDLDFVEDEMFQRWDARIKALAIRLLTVRVLEACPPVKKAGQLDLYLTDFRINHPSRFQKKLRVSPTVFDRLVELIENHEIFHNNSNVPQLPVPVQLAILLVRLGHYGNASAPEYVAQWAGVSVGTVINSTYRCFVAFLALHDEAVVTGEGHKTLSHVYTNARSIRDEREGFRLTQV
jgi:hypothetical protein